MGGACYPITFRTEGVEQNGDLFDKDDGKGDDDDPEEDDLLEDKLKELEKQGENEKQDDGGKDGGDQSAGKKLDQKKGEGSSQPKNGSKSVRRSLQFQGGGKEFNLEHTRCVNLLSAMELEGFDEEGTNNQTSQLEMQPDDEEMLQLPVEWVNSVVAQRKRQSSDGLLILQTGSVEESTDKIEVEEEIQNTQPTVEENEKVSDRETKKMNTQSEQVKKTRKAKQIWDPLPSLRRSKRVTDDGRMTMEKAQDAKRKHNLEDMQENSVEEYGYTLTPDSEDGSKMGDPVSYGEEGNVITEGGYDQRCGYSSAMASVEMKVSSVQRWRAELNSEIGV